jgi:3-oxoacyl-[acyl-carrier-protein] synthase II
MGAISPCGNDVATLWESIKNGRSGVTRITRFDASEHEVKIAAEVKDFDPKNWMEAKDARKMALFTQYAVAAAAQAMAQAGLKEGGLDPIRTGVYIGTGIGGFEVLHASYGKYYLQGWTRMLPLTIPLLISNEAAGNIAMQYGIHGPALTSVTACSSGTDGLGAALDLIRSGRVDVCIAGGTEAALTPFTLGGFEMLKTLSTAFNDEPERASRPFDKKRDGFVLGEGAGVMVLERESHARSRGATILAEFAGYGASCDAYHITSPDPDGTGGALAIKLCLDDAGLRPQDVQYYNAHGTSTPINDPTETKALKAAFGEHVRSLRVSSTKSMTGHCIGGTGAIEAIISVMAMREGFFPPTINQEEPDPECDLDYIPNQGAPGRIDAVLSSTLGFGGHNGVVAFRRYTE